MIQTKWQLINLRLQRLFMKTRHERISLRKAGSVDYFYIDYEGVTPGEATVMLQALLDDMKEYKLPFIANFKGLRITPKYLVKANEWIDGTKNLVPFGVFIGFDNTQMVIFEAIKSINGLKHQSSRTIEKAEEALQIYYTGKSKS